MLLAKVDLIWGEGREAWIICTGDMRLVVVERRWQIGV